MQFNKEEDITEEVNKPNLAPQLGSPTLSYQIDQRSVHESFSSLAKKNVQFNACSLYQKIYIMI